MSIPYAVSFSAYKVDNFLEKFSRFQDWCRLGYLKPLHSKDSKSELFPIYSPRKGMETIYCITYMLFNWISFPIYSPRKGMETLCNFQKKFCGFFPIYSPRKGMETIAAWIEVSEVKFLNQFPSTGITAEITAKITAKFTCNNKHTWWKCLSRPCRAGSS